MVPVSAAHTHTASFSDRLYLVPGTVLGSLSHTPGISNILRFQPSRIQHSQLKSSIQGTVPCFTLSGLRAFLEQWCKPNCPLIFMTSSLQTQHHMDDNTKFRCLLEMEPGTLGAAIVAAIVFAYLNLENISLKGLVQAR